MQWKDTINIPMETTARFLVSFDERPGEWMFHRHILDHAEGGLMGTVNVGGVKTTEHIQKRAGRQCRSAGGDRWDTPTSTCRPANLPT